MIEIYLQKFSKLRTDRGQIRYPTATNHRAPHKPFLLLSVMDLIAQGKIVENFIEPSFELVDTWNGYWNAVMPIGHRSTMAHPYPRLKTDGFWHLIANLGFDAEVDYNVTSMAKCRQTYAGAKLDDELFGYMCNSEIREQLRTHIIEAFFAPVIRAKVWAQGIANIKSFEYEKQLIAGVNEPNKFFDEAPEDEQQKIRDQGFRRAIVNLYDHRCALCGIRMLTPEGHTVVEAAHIVPWSISHDDNPTNGLCLCRLCHWSFDEGLMGVGRKYEVLVSGVVKIEQNILGHVLALQDRPIFGPHAETHWPAQDNLKKHREETFRRA